MSGQLVGEVLAAATSLRSRGLSETAFHALIAIAEKAGVDARQGSVPWSHICAGIYGSGGELPSKRTAERAVRELKDAKLIEVVKVGFSNRHLSRAPIYRVLAVVDADIQVSVSGGDDTDTQVSVSRNVDTDKPGPRYRQTEPRYRHPGVVLNGPINGPSNARDRGGSRCDGANCLTCKIIRNDIDHCDECDSAARRPDGPDGAPGSDCPHHGNFRLHTKRKATA